MARLLDCLLGMFLVRNAFNGIWLSSAHGFVPLPYCEYSRKKFDAPYNTGTMFFMVKWFNYSVFVTRAYKLRHSPTSQHVLDYYKQSITHVLAPK